MRLLLVLLLVSPVSAGLSYKAETGIESRKFDGDGAPATDDLNLGIYGRLELTSKAEHYANRLRLFSRADLFDSKRFRFNVEEAYGAIRASGWNVRLGAQIVNWSATEAFHPADILNARNFDSNVENAEKIGEPMLMVSHALAGGLLSGYYMPLRTAPQLPGRPSRLSYLPPGVELGDAAWAEQDGSLSRGIFEHQGALRYARTISSMDIGLHLVRHRDRSQPLLFFDPALGTFRPVFLTVTQGGATFQQALGSFLLKVETGWRSFDLPDRATRLGTVKAPDHGLAAWGLEYGWNNPSGCETTMILEGQSVLGLDERTRADVSLFQQDALLGIRHTFNDRLSKEIFVSFIFDLERADEYLFNVSYSQRFTDTVSFKTGLRVIQAPRKGPALQGLEGLHRADQLFLTLTRHY